MLARFNIFTSIPLQSPSSSAAMRVSSAFLCFGVPILNPEPHSITRWHNRLGWSRVHLCWIFQRKRIVVGNHCQPVPMHPQANT